MARQDLKLLYLFLLLAVRLVYWFTITS